MMSLVRDVIIVSSDNGLMSVIISLCGVVSLCVVSMVGSAELIYLPHFYLLLSFILTNGVSDIDLQVDIYYDLRIEVKSK